mmetsp:Transcript_41397/g.111181  ORF Transcript_41397/g.111181 Transcript_41397/m.111181 type:complete len:120 (-) Transcript_41397:166-525(-)
MLGTQCARPPWRNSRRPERAAKEQLATMERYCTELATKRPGLQVWQNVAAEVKYCYLEKTHTRDYKKLVVNFKQASNSDQIFENIVMPVLLREPEADQLPGIAPKGDLERELQKWLDEQ